jgi:hypothetical protein
MMSFYPKASENFLIANQEKRQLKAVRHLQWRISNPVFSHSQQPSQHFFQAIGVGENVIQEAGDLELLFLPLLLELSPTIF